ncbi:hypothetical protein NPIL_244731 [Nephila pilipes]|uniref:Uncharacterized protein n=1 Tax=Nephila pilipes TaxID=299642 RepID=A0A8X6QAF9_NEPPI|nr:hypothetical protein NPIL_244731 [Nephila pilipes]
MTLCYLFEGELGRRKVREEDDQESSERNFRSQACTSKTDGDGFEEERKVRPGCWGSEFDKPVERDFCIILAHPQTGCRGLTAAKGMGSRGDGFYVCAHLYPSGRVLLPSLKNWRSYEDDEFRIRWKVLRTQRSVSPPMSREGL